MNNHTEGCTLKLADHRVRYSFGPLNYLFFQFPTKTLVKGPHKKPFPNVYHGLVNMNNIDNCKISTKTFTILPKTSILTTPAFTTKATKVTVLDSEWLKIFSNLMQINNNRKTKNQIHGHKFELSPTTTMM